MTITEIYLKSGGREAAAALCGVSTWATYKWDIKGIPPNHWRTFAEKLDVSLEDIASSAVMARVA